MKRPRKRYIVRDQQPWFLTPAEQAHIASFGPPEELETCQIIVIPAPANKPQPGDAAPTTNPTPCPKSADAAPANPSQSSAENGTAAVADHWMKDLFLKAAEPKPSAFTWEDAPEPRPVAEIKADMDAAQELPHNLAVAHEEGSWGAAGCPRCDTMQPLFDEFQRARLRGPEGAADA